MSKGHFFVGIEDFFFCVLIAFSLIVPIVGLTLYGLYLAFTASIILGILALVFEPSPFVLGLLGLFGHADIAQRIAHWLGL